MKAGEKIDYSLFKQMPDFLDLLMNGKPQDYCRKQCLKMCFYLQNVRKIEILQMKCEFLLDDNGNCWLSRVWDIHMRPAKVDTKKLEKEQKSYEFTQFHKRYTKMEQGQFESQTF